MNEDCQAPQAPQCADGINDLCVLR